LYKISWSHVDWWSFASTSEVWTSAILEWLKVRIKRYGVEVTFDGMTSLLNSIKIYKLVQKLGGRGHRDRMVISYASLSFSRKVS
jgi:hypothetical protein